MVKKDQTMGFNKIDFNKDSISIGDDFTMYSGFINSFVLECPVHSDREYIGLCLEGYAELEINLIKHTLQKNEMVLISQKQIVFHHHISEDFQLLTFSFSKKILSEMVNDLSKYPPLFVFFRQKFPSVMLKENEMKQVVDYYHLMLNVTKDEDNDYRRDIVKHLLCSFLIDVHWFVNQNVGKPAPVTKKQEMTGAFFRLIFEHFKEARDVSFYADKLCVSPKHLSSLTKKEVGKNAKECIDYYVILQSKVLLNSTLSIQEISQQMNFPNQSFFGKYFKKHSGVSPVNYRKSREQ